MSNYTRIGFGDIETNVPALPGVYAIHMISGTPLKVGISGDLRRRLRQHRESKQSCLKLRPGGSWNNPADVKSKRSILTKHLYFAKPIDGYNLKTEDGRRLFLVNECYVLVQVTPTRQEARELERKLEAEGSFRFRGRVSEGEDNGE